MLRKQIGGETNAIESSGKFHVPAAFHEVVMSLEKQDLSVPQWHSLFGLLLFPIAIAKLRGCQISKPVSHYLRPSSRKRGHKISTRGQ